MSCLSRHRAGVFTANEAPEGSILSVPGNGIATLVLTRVFASSNVAGIGGGVQLGDNVTALLSESTFEGNTAESGQGACMWLFGNAATTVSACTFKENTAKFGAVLSVADTHSVLLSGSQMRSNGAFAGAIVHVANSVVVADELVRLETLEFINNSATAPWLVFLDSAASAPAPACGDCSFLANRADAGPQTYGTLPERYEVTAASPAVRSGAICRISVVMFDQFDIPIQSWPDLTVRAINDDALSGAMNNQTYAGASTTFTLLRVTGDLDANVSIPVRSSEVKNDGSGWAS